jgi:chemotaxis protein CheX
MVVFSSNSKVQSNQEDGSLLLTESITNLLNGMLEAVTHVLPMSMHRESPTLVQAPIQHVEMGVLVGVTGYARGRLLVAGSPSMFSAIAERMFGVSLSGEMLESFVGELGNMIAGNMSTKLSVEGHSVDITPPTVMVGDTRLSGFRTAISVPLTLEDIGAIQVVMIIEE